jgi:HAMP domain-containing protein
LAKRRKVIFSLQFKIMFLIFSLILVTMAVIFYWSFNTNLAMQEREIKKSASQVIDTLSALRLVTSWKSNKVDWTIYQKYMAILAKLDRNIILMAIMDEKGGIKAYSINDDVLKTDFKEIAIKDNKDIFIKDLVDMKINDVLKWSENIKIKGEQLSKITIKFSKKSFIGRMYITLINMAILTVILLGAGFFSAWGLASLITGNFNIIAAGMRKVAEGDLHVEVNVKANDEVGVLSDDFNRMIVELREKVRIKDAFETVADGLKDMDDLKKAYRVLAYQDMTDKITKGYTPAAGQAEATRAVFIFIDISAFAGFTYELISEEMRDIIEKFVEKVSLTALEYQGAVLKVTDSYVLLSFGYPFSHTDDMKRAMISTVEIRKELVSMVKGKLTMGYNIEDFGVNFVMVQGTVIKSFIEKGAMDKFRAVVDYLKFASKYGEKKKYKTDIYATNEIAAGTASLATFEKIDSVTMGDGGNIELLKLKGTKF